MTDQSSPSSAAARLEIAERVDEVCDRFEAAWIAGQRPSIERFLQEVPGAGRGDAIGLLVTLDLGYRADLGQRPAAAEYLKRFPQYAAVRQALRDTAARPWAASSREAATPDEPDRAEPSPSASDPVAAAPAPATSAAEPALAAALPSRFGDYEILNEIARGGMGVVCRARQVSLDRIVAVKMLRGDAGADPHDLDRFQAEAAAAAGLRHPGIVAIHEIGQHQGRPFISMDYIDGRNLDQFDLPLDPRVAARYVRAVAEAIDYAHRQGVLHRDLKPANILIDRDDQVHVTDFGLAKRVEGGTNLTATGQILGTPGFMPPEQALGDRARVGPRSDVYALGALLYALLTGIPPFRAASTTATLFKVVQADPQPPRTLNPSTPRDLETVCLACLEKEPARRYRSARAMAADLQRFLRGEPIQARPLGPTARTVRWCRRYRARAAAIALLVFVSIGAPLVAIHEALLRSELATAGRDGTVKLWKVASAGLVGTLSGHSGEVLAVAFSPAGKMLATGGADATVRLWEWPGGNLRATLTRHTDAVYDVAFSADGKLLASASKDRSIILWQAASGQYERTLTGHRDGVLSVAFSPDGKAIASASSDGSFRLWDVGSGETTGSYIGHSRGLRSVAFSPARAQVATGSDDKTIKLWDVSPQPEEVTLHGHTDTVWSVAFSPDGKTVASSSADRTIKLWDCQQARLVATLTGHQDEVDSIAFSAAGKTLASGSDDGTVRLWDVATKRARGTVYQHADNVNAVAFSPDGTLLASGSKDRTVKVFDLTADDMLVTLHHHDKAVSAVAFSPDGRLLASASADRSAVLWDVAGRCVRARLSGHRDTIRAIAFAPDGKTLATAGRYASIRLWDVATGRESTTLAGRTNVVRCLGFFPDGQTLASGGNDEKVRLWNVATGEQVAVLGSRAAIVYGLAIAPDGKSFASGYGDGLVILRQAATERQVIGASMSW